MLSPLRFLHHIPGNLKIAKYLVSKGAYINHQNKNGQTPGHFAIAYQFFELSHWLFENGGDDQIENKYGLTPYDGISPEGTVDE
jgi:ankyrin repeat protein